MSKEYSNYIKGVAILLMVCLHIFKSGTEASALGNLFTIGDVPLVMYLTRMCNPVPFFLMVSGYGLYSVFSRLGGGKSLEADCQPVCTSLAHLFDIRAAGLLGKAGNVSWVVSEVC